MGGCTGASGFGIPFGEGEVTASSSLRLTLFAKAGERVALPYRLFYPREQLHKRYPEIDDLFAVKKRYDPRRPRLEQVPRKVRNGSSAVASSHLQRGTTKKGAIARALASAI
jgi:hypothetical protein